jgi:hypothetical protein
MDHVPSSLKLLLSPAMMQSGTWLNFGDVRCCIPGLAEIEHDP